MNDRLPVNQVLFGRVPSACGDITPRNVPHEPCPSLKSLNIRGLAA